MRCGIVKKCYADVVLLSLTLLYVASAEAPSSVCPPREIIQPCSCQKYCDICPSDLLCENIRDQKILHRVLDESREYPYDTFTLYKASVMYIPDNLFTVQGLSNLAVNDSSMVSLFNAGSTTHPALRHIVLEKVLLQRGIQWEQFSRFTNLKVLGIVDTHLPRIDQKFVDSIPKTIEKLGIYNCSTSKVHDEAFASLKNVIWVTVQNGKIRELKRSMFPRPSKLMVFDFSENQLPSLPEDMFSEMPELTHIFLQGNVIKELPENTYARAFQNLKVFNFLDNPLHCKCAMSWIIEYGARLKRKYFLGNCHDPKNLYGKEIGDLVPEDFSHCR